MYENFMKNIDIEGFGGVAASPNKVHPVLSVNSFIEYLKGNTYYYYHWMVN